MQNTYLGSEVTQCDVGARQRLENTDRAFGFVRTLRNQIRSKLLLMRRKIPLKTLFCVFTDWLIIQCE